MMKGKGRWRGRRFVKYGKGDREGDGGERKVRKKGTDREEKLKVDFEKIKKNNKVKLMDSLTKREND